MIGGSQSEVKSGYKLLTGIGEVIVKSVNPTNEEYQELTGNELPYSLSYDTVQFGDVSATPIKFLVFNEENDKYDFVNFLISHNASSNRDGNKFRFIDSLGQVTYFVSDPSEIEMNSKVDFYSKIERKILAGEEHLHSFLQALVKYRADREDSNWLEDVSNMGITPENLISGNIDGLRKLIEFANSNNNSIGIVYTVNPKDKQSDDGEVVTKYYQEISNKAKTFFWIDDTGKVSNSSYKRLKDEVMKGEQSGYPVFRDRLFTYKLQEFNLENCVNSADNAPAETSTSAIDAVLDL